MNYLVVALSILCGLILAGATISLFALRRVQRLSRDMNARASAAVTPAPKESDRELRQAVEAIAAELNELRNSASAEPPDPAGPRPGLNVTKRSQALRLHRRGESIEQIATAL